MRSFVCLLLLCLFSFSSCSHRHEDIVAFARQEKAAVNKKLNEYERRETTDQISKDYGAIVGYFDDDQPVRISTQNFGTRDRVFREYYFYKGELLLTEEQLFVYNKPTTYTEEVAKVAGDSVWYDDALTQLQQSYYYFEENKLVKWIGPDGKEVKIDSPIVFGRQTALLSKALFALTQLQEE